MWRLDNWGNPYRDELVVKRDISTPAIQMKDGRCYKDDLYRKMMESTYEAGADAMLNAVRRRLCEICLAGSDMPDCPLEEPCKLIKGLE